jgi:hypothetical protein
MHVQALPAHLHAAYDMIDNRHEGNITESEQQDRLVFGIHLHAARNERGPLFAELLTAKLLASWDYPINWLATLDSEDGMRHRLTNFERQSYLRHKRLGNRIVHRWLRGPRTNQTWCQ